MASDQNLPGNGAAVHTAGCPLAALVMRGSEILDVAPRDVNERLSAESRGLSCVRQLRAGVAQPWDRWEC